MIRFKLISEKKRPAFFLPTFMHLKCLIDSGALISVWCNSVGILKACYPNSVKTNYRTTVSGFGGVSHKMREIWKIPEFIMLDDNGIDKYVVRNLLVAIVDDSQIQSFNMVLSTTVFHGSLYTVCDKNKDKHFEVDSEYDRPVYCVPDGFVDNNQYGAEIIDAMKLEDGDTIIAGTTVFFEDRDEQ